MKKDMSRNPKGLRLMSLKSYLLLSTLKSFWYEMVPFGT
jgi:hypothetical protein